MSSSGPREKSWITFSIENHDCVHEPARTFFLLLDFTLQNPKIEYRRRHPLAVAPCHRLSPGQGHPLTGGVSLWCLFELLPFQNFKAVHNLHCLQHRRIENKGSWIGRLQPANLLQVKWPSTSRMVGDYRWLLNNDHQMQNSDEDSLPD